MNIQQLNNELGNIDLYLLDQLLKGNISPQAKILDAGCGEGRNLIYFLNNGYNVQGIDMNPDAIRMLHFIVGSKFPNYDKANFQVGVLDNLPYKNDSFDYVICSAVLHFAKSTTQFWQMISEQIRIIKNGGTLFIRMASDIGLTNHIKQEDGVFLLPDGSMRFLLTKVMIDQLKKNYLLDDLQPCKTVVVDDMRCMTTLVLRKNNVN